MLVGVTDEDEGLVAKFIEENKVEYPIVISHQGGEEYGVRAYPTIWLVNAEGVIAGQWNRRDTTQIEKIVATVCELPANLPKTPEFEGLRTAWTQRRMPEYARRLAVLAAVPDLPQAQQEAVATLRSSFAAHLTMVAEEIDALAAGPDYLAAEARLHELIKRYDPLSPGTKAKSVLANFAKDAQVQKEISALKRFRALEQKLQTTKASGDRRQVLDLVRKLAKEQAGTHAAGLADKLVVEANGR